MESEERLKQFKLEGVIPVNPSDDVDSDIGHGSYGFVVEMNYRGLKCAGKTFHRDLYCHGNAEAREYPMLRRMPNTMLSITSQCRSVHRYHLRKRQPASRFGYGVCTIHTIDSSEKKQGILPEDISYGILVDVAMGLCYLHGRKPSLDTSPFARGV